MFDGRLSSKISGHDLTRLGSFLFFHEDEVPVVDPRFLHAVAPNFEEKVAVPTDEGLVEVEVAFVGVVGACWAIPGWAALHRRIAVTLATPTDRRQQRVASIVLNRFMG